MSEHPPPNTKRYYLMLLYHLSGNGGLEGIWKPISPAGTNDYNIDSNNGGDPFPYPEPDKPRICLSSDLKGALQAIYPNLRDKLLLDKPKVVTLHVYTPSPKQKINVVPTKVLCEKNWVWDAHITQEHWLLEPVVMEYYGTVEFTLKVESYNHTHPFGNTKLEKIGYHQVGIDTFKLIPKTSPSLEKYEESNQSLKL